VTFSSSRSISAALFCRALLLQSRPPLTLLQRRLTREEVRPDLEKFFAIHHKPPQFLRPRRPNRNARPLAHNLLSRSRHPGGTHRASAKLICVARCLPITALLDDLANHFFALFSHPCVPLRPFLSLFCSIAADGASSLGCHHSFIKILDLETMLHSSEF
jgi:hypothetical protein